MDNESKRRAPCFPFYVDDFISGTAIMSAEEVGMYVRLLCYQWNRGSIPVDPRLQQRLAGGSVPDAVLEKFSVGEDGLLRNSRLESIYRDRMQFVENQRKKGIASGQRRKNEPGGNRGSIPVATKPEPEQNRGSIPVEVTVEPDSQPKGNLPIPLPLPLPIPTPKDQPSVGAEAPKPDSKPPRKPRLPRPRNLLLDALMEGCQYTNPTRSQFQCGAKAIAEIKEADPDVTPERILEFCRTKRRDWNGEDFSPMAIAKHWRTPLANGVYVKTESDLEVERVMRLFNEPATPRHRPGIDD